MKLNHKQVTRLVDVLRRMFLYQTPRTVFKGDEPDYVVLCMKPDAYRSMMELIHEAGGWVLPPEGREAILKIHEAKVKTAVGTYDLSDMSVGDLYLMHSETEHIAKMAAFHAALSDEIRRRHGTAQVTVN